MAWKSVVATASLHSQEGVNYTCDRGLWFLGPGFPVWEGRLGEGWLGAPYLSTWKTCVLSAQVGWASTIANSQALELAPGQDPISVAF